MIAELEKWRTICMLGRDDVIELYLVFLGRIPESEAGIEAAISTHSDRSGLIKQLLSSEEYLERKGWLFRTKDANFFFSRAFSRETEQAQTELVRSTLHGRILTRLAAIESVQGKYQPIYGLDNTRSQSPRLGDLLLACSLVETHFNEKNTRGHVRIIDVGCNIGFVTFKLAETFSKTIGIDGNKNNIDFCKDLQVYTNSSARFFYNDITKLMESGDLDTDNVDCVLLLNVVHQLIFSKGLSYVRKFLARLTKRVDVVFLELARKEDYVSHGKDNLLPEDPATVLSDCEGCRIELLKSEGRPLYKVMRNEARFGPLLIQPERISFTDSAKRDIDRKYYFGTDTFLKVFRFSRLGDVERQSYDRERRGLLEMSGTMLAPQILDWTATATYGAVLMERIKGQKLVDLYHRFAEATTLNHFLRQYLEIAAKLGQAQLYHNDMSAHNIYVLEDDSIRIVDFEQTKTMAVIDPFGSMLWTIFDILSRAPISYVEHVTRKLYLKGKIRADRASYPGFSSFKLSDRIHDFLEDALTHDSWFGFVAEWRSNLP
jgi:SAM-dependent methyltransferase